MKDQEVMSLLHRNGMHFQGIIEKELQLMKGAIEQNSIAILIANTQGIIEYANEPVTLLTGYSLEEIIGANNNIFKSGYHPLAFYREMWDTILAGEKWSGEILNKKKSGEYHWIHATISPIKDINGKVHHFVSVKEDITALKKLEKTQQFLYDISQISFTGISLKEYLRKIHLGLSKLLSAENFYIALYDYPTGLYSFPYHVDQYDEVDETSLHDLKYTLTDYVRKNGKGMLVTEEIDRHLRESAEIQLVGSPSPIWVGAPLQDSTNNEVIGVIALQDYYNSNTYTLEDLSTLEIIASQIGLFIGRVKQNEDLKIAKEKAEESDRLKSAFLANMSHEIRTPMNGILGFTELLKDPNLSREERENYIQIIMKSGQRMLDTVNDIIEISKIEAGLSEIALSDFNLNDELQDLYHFFHRETSNKQIALILNSSNHHLHIRSDRNKLLSILTNLIKNAIKFTNRGKIEITVNQVDKWIHFAVLDTGMGIPKDKLEAIFNRFEQGDMAITRGYEGTGLGLAITKAYVELLGGSIQVTSSRGAGSVFTFSIPYNPAEPIEPRVPEKVEQNLSDNQQNLKILIAEDDQISFQYMQMLLKPVECTILRAMTGKDVVRLYAEHASSIDLILMDIKMPEMDGYTATQEIRKINSSVPIIAQTAYSLAGDMEKAIQSGCNYYLSKPLKRNDLLHIIHTIMHEKEISV